MSKLPQLELGPTLGGIKVHYQRSSIISGLITMVSAMTAAWSTSHTIRSIFQGSFFLFLSAVILALTSFMVVDHIVLFPSEQSYNQEQSQRPERSPLKRDTERINQRLDEMEQWMSMRADGGEREDDA